MTAQRPTATPLAVLLDTNALLWLVSAPEQVSDSARQLLGDPDTEILVSAASAWEIAIKTRLGRLNGEPLLSAWSDIIADMTATDLAIEAGDVILAGRLPWEHKDPFDRMLVAQAARRNLTLATSDVDILRAALTRTLKPERTVTTAGHYTVLCDCRRNVTVARCRIRMWSPTRFRGWLTTTPRRRLCSSRR